MIFLNEVYLKEVKNIDLSHCKQITDQGLSYLKGVQNIDLSHCKQITDQGLSYLKDAKNIVKNNK